jgi:Flp pilus assembly protein TadG
MHHPHRLPHIHLQLQKFAANRRANVAIIFSLCMLTIMLLIGATIDYSRALTLPCRKASTPIWRRRTNLR